MGMFDNLDNQPSKPATTSQKKVVETLIGKRNYSPGKEQWVFGVGWE